MRTLASALIAAGLSVTFVQVVSAADIAARAPLYAAPPPVFNWTGFYVGGHVGYGWSDETATTTVTGAGIPIDPARLGQNGHGVIGGGQVGYNWQFAPNWVLGIEGDISGTGINNLTTGPVTSDGIPVGANHLAGRDINWLATVRGRFGYAVDRWLLYATGGGSWGDVRYTQGPMDIVSFNKTQSGWTAGGGVEYAFTNNWTARAEYLYYDLDGASGVNALSSVPGIIATQTWAHTRVNVVRAGVNYKF